MSLYSEYTKEVEGFEVEESEHGFATYRVFPQQSECYIRDVYVHPDHRNTKVAASLADAISVKAKILGCKYLSGTVDPTGKNSTRSTQVLISYGMKMIRFGEGLIWFVKEI